MMMEVMAMNESIVVVDEDNFPISKTLLDMGISVKNQNYGTRLRGALDNFNACYLETLDFLNQILPLAKQQFSKPDAILLPKTPAKKRARKHLTRNDNLGDIIELNSPPQEIKKNIQSKTASPVFVQPIEVPFKRQTRSSKSKTKEIIELNNTIEKHSVQSSDKENIKPGDVSESVLDVTDKESAKHVTRSNNETKKTNSKRKSSKKSRQSNVIVETSIIPNTEQKLEKNDNNESKEPLVVKNLKRSRSHSPPVLRKNKRSKSGDSFLVVDEASMQTDISEENVKSAIGCSEENVADEIESEKCSDKVLVVDLESVSDNDMNTSSKTNSDEERPEAMTDNNNDRNAMVISPLKSIKLDTNNVNEIIKNQNKCEESGESSEVSSKKRKSEEAGLGSPTHVLVGQNRKSNQVPCIVIAESPDMLTCNSDGVHDNPKDCFVAPSPMATKILSTPDIAPEHVKTPEAENIESANSEPIKEESNPIVSSQKAYVRRSHRSSRRVSKLSLGNPGNRRSSRRLSRQSHLFKKPQNMKKMEHSVVTTSSESDCDMDCQISTEAVSPVKKQLSSTDSDEEPMIDLVGPTTSTPDVEKPRRSLRLSKKTSLNSDLNKTKTLSNNDHNEPNVGKVAGIIQEINKNNKFADKPANGSIHSTPNGVKKMKRLGSSVKRSSTKPSNLVGGNVRSFIKRPSIKKHDPNETVRLKKLELQRKEEKEKERLGQAEMRRKNWADEQKRKREEKQKRVAEAKAARDKEEQEKKERQLEEKKQLLQMLEQARKKKEQEEEQKKKLREQRKEAADARRLKENEERLKKIHDKEEEEKIYREMLKRKQEHDEQERKQRILDEKRQQEQKQRERQREQAEERERKLREIKEKEDEKNKEEAERREKERKQKENEDREKKRIAQLIKEKMEQDKKLKEERREKEEKERREREEERKKLQANKQKHLHTSSSTTTCKPAAQTHSADSYLMTPPPAQTRKPSTNENYDISDIRSDESTDDEDCPRKKVPAWAQGAALKIALLNQAEPRRLFTLESGPYIITAPNLEEIFTKKRRRFYQRTSSAHWDTPPLKKVY